jgi:hypothetical protein
MIEPLIKSSSARSPSPTSPLRPGPAKQTTDWLALGAAMREVELIVGLAREAHEGRIRIPLDELDVIEVDTTGVAKPPWPQALAELLRTRHRSLRHQIAGITGDIVRGQQPELRGLLVWAALVWRLSQRAERVLPERFRPRRFDAVNDALFAWRVARQATLGRFRLN